MSVDRFGLGWRPPLAAGILAHLDRLDVIEVLAEDALEGGAKGLSSLRLLGLHRPLVVHGTGLGLASATPVAEGPLASMARVCEALRPVAWSEHLAFVRSGGVEIGHLAAPPRSAAVLEGLVRNVARARSVVGTAPLLENIASLVEPPLCAWSETAWLGRVTEATGCGLLLDLHNLHTNARNGGWEARAALREIPVAQVRQVHLAGGRGLRVRGGATRWLDDHRHPVPDEVFILLQDLGALGAPPLTVILERDGDYPPFTELLAEVDRARTALADGRREAA